MRNTLLLIFLLFFSVHSQNITQLCVGPYWQEIQFVLCPPLNQGCQIMQNQKTCSQCYWNYLLDRQTGQCRQYLENSPISGCKYMANQKQCAVCLDSFKITSLKKCIPDGPVFPLLEGCLIMRNQFQCQKCQQFYVLDQVTKQCTYSRLVADYKNPSIDLGDPIGDTTIFEQETYGATAGVAHKFNLKNHPILNLYYIREGTSESAVLGVYVSLVYRRFSDSNDFILVVVFTECGGALRQIFYGPFQDGYSGPVVTSKRIISSSSNLNLFKIQYLGNELFNLFFKNNLQIIRYPFSNSDTAIRTPIPSSLIEILLPAAQEKIKSAGQSFSLAAENSTQIGNTVIFYSGNLELSVSVVGCSIIVNDIVTRAPEQFHRIYNEARANTKLFSISQPYQSLISVRSPVTGQTQYKVSYSINGPDRDHSIEISMQNINGESVYTQVIVDGDNLLDELASFKAEIEAEPPINTTFQYVLQRPECKIIRQDGTCQQCHKGYKLATPFACASDKCVLLPSYQCTTNQCLISLKIQCLYCEQGYHPLGVHCLPNTVPNCQTYHEITDTCKFCDETFTLTENNTCEKVPFIRNEVPFCVEYTQYSECAACESNHNLFDGWCYMKIKNCGIYNTTDGKCLNCTPGYKNTGSECIIQCPVGYYPTQNGQCIRPNSQNCQVVDPQTLLCSMCDFGYYFIEGRCQLGACARPSIGNPRCLTEINGVCTSCIQRYYLTDGVCLKVSNICTEYTQNGICTRCHPDFMFSADGRCVSNRELCQKYIDGICVQCPNRSVFQNNVCVPVSDQCQTWSNSTGDCTSCYGGYYLRAGVCILGTDPNSDPYCKTGDVLACSQCYEGYFSFRGCCQLKSPFCIDQNFDTGFCTSCSPGYTVVGGACKFV